METKKEKWYFNLIYYEPNLGKRERRTERWNREVEKLNIKKQNVPLHGHPWFKTSNWGYDKLVEFTAWTVWKSRKKLWENKP